MWNYAFYSLAKTIGKCISPLEKKNVALDVKRTYTSIYRLNGCYL